MKFKWSQKVHRIQLWGDFGLERQNGDKIRHKIRKIGGKINRLPQLLTFNTSYRRTALYHPQANGGVERFNSKLGTALQLARGGEESRRRHLQLPRELPLDAPHNDGKVTFGAHDKSPNADAVGPV